MIKMDKRKLYNINYKMKAFLKQISNIFKKKNKLTSASLMPRIWQPGGTYRILNDTLNGRLILVILES